jgi:2-keto-3-deoxy-L-fuconate dehydrogenase
MNPRLKGLTALLTAAGQGIGRATALAFAEEGAMVWATDINQAALDQLALERAGIRTSHLDVLDEKAIQRLVAHVGRLDVRKRLGLFFRY